MRRDKDQKSLADLLQSFVKENKLEAGIEKIEVRDAWVKLMGPGVNKYTTEVQLRNQTLYVGISSSVLRQELSYGKEKIVKLINEELQKEVVKKVVLR